MLPSSENASSTEFAPLKSLDQWEEDILQRYPDPESIVKGKQTGEYRNYENPERDTVKEFYRIISKSITVKGLVEVAYNKLRDFV